MHAAAEPQHGFPEQPSGNFYSSLVAIYLFLQLMKHNSILSCTLLNAFQLFLQHLSFVFWHFV